MVTSTLRGLLVLACTACLSSCFAYSVMVDPGHGGSDAGAVGCGQYEKYNNYNTSQKFAWWMQTDAADGNGGGNWSVYMTRWSDTYVSLSGRTSYANSVGVDRFMSIHNNACCGGTGTETYCWGSGSSNSYDIRNKVQYRMINAWGLTNRGNKTANFYVLVYTNMPAELAELGFIDNCGTDANYVGNSTRQNSAALAHLYAIQTHYAYAAYTPGQAQTYTNDSPSCSSNWSTGTSASDKYGTNYRYRSTAAVGDAASWSFSIPTTGNYDVSAWWSQGTNRSSTAPFIIRQDAGTVTVAANQQVNGGKFNLLRTSHTWAGTNAVQLSCWTTTGFVVVADAVRMYGPK